MIRTIMADSAVGATKEYLDKYQADSGDVISVKERGKGDWINYDVK